MRHGIQILFLIFYVASSYAISQERTSLVVSDIQHGGSRADIPSVDSRFDRLDADYPNFRHAKPKDTCDIYFWHFESVHLVPHVVERSFHPLTVSLGSNDPDAIEPPRAPPVLG
jgi:hypothetical protein